MISLREITAADPKFPRLVDDYAAALSKGFKFPPIVCRVSEGKITVQDGHHRYAAALRAGREYIEAYVR
jgi:ParB-like chromosome segregation protein Spo0J